MHGFGVGGMISYLIRGDREKRLLPEELIGVQWDLTRPLTFEEKVAQALAKLPRQNGPDYFLRMAKYSAFGGATAFTALALYTSWVEQPVRLELEADNANADALKQWKGIYSRAMPIQLCLAIFTGLQGVAIVYRSGGDRIWLLGSLLMLANLPYTYLCIMPLNKRLMARHDSPHNNAADDEEETTRADLQRWGKLHRVRLMIGLFAVAIFAYATLVDGGWD